MMGKEHFSRDREMCGVQVMSTLLVQVQTYGESPICRLLIPLDDRLELQGGIHPFLMLRHGLTHVQTSASRVQS